MPYQNYGYPQYQIPQIPYQPFGQQNQQSLNGYIKVKGYEGAKAFYMTPNSRAPLFDTDKDVFYDVTTDSNGNKDIVTVPYNYPKEQQDPTYATKDDLENLQNSINVINNKFDMLWETLNGKQSVSSTQSNSTK